MLYKGSVVTDMDLADILMHQQERRPSRRQSDDRHCEEELVEASPRDEAEEQRLGDGAPPDA